MRGKKGWELLGVPGIGKSWGLPQRDDDNDKKNDINKVPKDC